MAAFTNLSSSWIEDYTRTGQTFSPIILTATTASLTVCLAFCMDVGNYSTYSMATLKCACFGSLTGMESAPGTRLWQEQGRFPGYVYSRSLAMYIRLVHNDRQEHDIANSMCSLEGGRLAVLDTIDKLNFVSGIPTYQNYTYYHICGSDRVVEDTFRWTTGSVVSRDPLFWLPYQPDNYEGVQHCIVMYKNALDDAACYIKTNYICEIS